jgi:hypothetical protein
MPGSPKHSRRTERLTYEEIPTRCSEYLLCVAAGETGPVFWPAWKATASMDDLAHAVSWTRGIELLQASGLTIGLDVNGFAHIRFISAEARAAARKMKRVIANDGLPA